MDERDDTALVERSLAGDRDAFGDLVDAYGAVVFNLARRMCRNDEDARDLTQNVFVKAFEKLDTFDRRNRFFSWIYRIAINESLNHRSRQRRHEALDEDRASERRGPEEQAAAAEENGLVQNALQELSPDHRAAIVLRHFDGLGHRAMSEVLGIPEKTVKSRLHEARARLATILRRNGCGPA